MTGVLHPDEVETVLHRNHVGRLACVDDGIPYVVPITYTYAEGMIYGRTMPGRKVDAMRRQPRVCFEVDERWDEVTWRSVVADGIYEELTEEADRRAALRLLSGALPDTASAAAEPPCILFRLRLTEKTGRFVLRSVATHPLEPVEAPLLGVDLRAGDERNWPRHE